MATQPISRDGMTGVRLTNVDSTTVKQKISQMQGLYEVAPKTYVSGSVDTDIEMSQASGQFLEVTVDADGNMTTEYSGTVKLFPPQETNLWELVDVLVPLSMAAETSVRTQARKQ